MVLSETTTYTIEIFSKTLYLDGRQAAPNDGTWIPVMELGNIQEFNSVDEALDYLKTKHLWIYEECKSEWRIIEETTTRVVKVWTES